MTIVCEEGKAENGRLKVYLSKLRRGAVIRVADTRVSGFN